MSTAKPSFPRLRRSHDLAQGLIGAWLLYEGGGTIANDLADFITNGTAGEGGYGTFNGALSWGQGQAGYCVTGFLGNAPTTTTWIDCGNSSKLNPTGGISFVGWIKATGGFNASGNIVIARDDNTLGRSFEFGPNGGSAPAPLGLGINGANTIATAESPITQNVWWMIAFTGSVQAGYQVYFGSYEAGAGLKVSATTAAWTAPNTTTGALTIGKRTFASQQFGLQGQIESAFLWNRGLSANEVEMMFADSYDMARHRSWRLKASAAPVVQPPKLMVVYGDPPLNEDVLSEAA